MYKIKREQERDKLVTSQPQTTTMADAGGGGIVPNLKIQVPNDLKEDGELREDEDEEMEEGEASDEEEEVEVNVIIEAVRQSFLTLVGEI